MSAFQTTTYGKWILAGEHAVLRGTPAIAFPLTSRALTLEFEPGAAGDDVEFSGAHGEEYELLFSGVLDQALRRLHVKAPPVGRFRVASSLPVGTGLGASAALCGAVARWCEAQGWITDKEIYEFARGLEDMFHGESSGVDLAVSLSSEGVRFVRGGPRVRVEPRWWPHLTLSYCGRRGMTSECVAKVKALFASDPERAARLDHQMAEAVTLAERALVEEGPERGLDRLAHALSLARGCFEEWQLCGGDLGRHLSELERAGCLAAKPTGSGGGGFVLSLWTHEPPASMGDLIPVPRPSLKL